MSATAPATVPMPGHPAVADTPRSSIVPSSVSADVLIRSTVLMSRSTSGRSSPQIAYPRDRSMRKKRGSPLSLYTRSSSVTCSANRPARSPAISRRSVTPSWSAMSANSISTSCLSIGLFCQLWRCPAQSVVHRLRTVLPRCRSRFRTPQRAGHCSRPSWPISGIGPPDPPPLAAQQVVASGSQSLLRRFHCPNALPSMRAGHCSPQTQRIVPMHGCPTARRVRTTPPDCVLSTARPAALGGALHVAVKDNGKPTYGQYARYATAPQSRGTGHQWNVTFLPSWPGAFFHDGGGAHGRQRAWMAEGFLDWTDIARLLATPGPTACRPTMPPNRWAEMRHRPPRAPRPGHFREVLARHADQSPDRRRRQLRGPPDGPFLGGGLSCGCCAARHVPPARRRRPLPARRDSHSGISLVPHGPSIPAAQPSGLRSRDEPSRQWGRDGASTTRPSLQSEASVPAPE